MANELDAYCVKVFIPLKLKLILMQTARILQAVVLMMIVAIAASCAASKEYTSKLFAPRVPVTKDSSALAAKPLRFLTIDSIGDNQEGWVSTDIIMGRDSSVSTVALDKLAQTFPVSKPVTDSAVKKETAKTVTPVADTKEIPMETIPVAKAANPGEIRNKRTREK